MPRTSRRAARHNTTPLSDIMAEYRLSRVEATRLARRAGLSVSRRGEVHDPRDGGWDRMADLTHAHIARRKNPDFKHYLAAGKKYAAQKLADAAVSAKAAAEHVQEKAAQVQAAATAAAERKAVASPEDAIRVLARAYGLTINPRSKRRSR